MPATPLTKLEEKKVLNALGLNRIEDLFSSIPPQVREKAAIQFDFENGYDVKNGLTEHELRKYFHGLSQKNAHFPNYTHFLGGGIYDNIIPSIVQQLVLRGEFLTCYTPYQPEISQGTLQVIFEFQTLMSRITAMPVANASMYDGATALAEACLMAQRLTGKQRILIASSTPLEYRAVCDTFLKNFSIAPTNLPYLKDGSVDREALKILLAEEMPAAVAVSSPNYFGIVEPLEEIRSLIPKECLFIVNVPDISALSLFEPPGNLGADIVVGEAHQLGTPMLFGGPHVGFFTTRKEFLRQMPGRLCGETVDIKGNRAYTLTLSTREQHIRREKATSNICTNQGLIALRTTIYLSFLGKQGFHHLGKLNYSLFNYLADELKARGITLKFQNKNYYREGVFEVPSLEKRFQKAVSQKVIPGIRLEEKLGSEFRNTLLISVNPKHTKEDLDKLVELISHD